MKPLSKSALIRIPALMAVVVPLCACDSIDLPRVWGPNEVPPEVINAPRAVKSEPPPPEGTPYPRLGDVPSRPKSFSSPEEIEKIKKQMDQEREQGKALRGRTSLDVSREKG